MSIAEWLRKQRLDFKVGVRYCRVNGEIDERLPEWGERVWGNDPQFKATHGHYKLGFRLSRQEDQWCLETFTLEDGHIKHNMICTLTLQGRAAGKGSYNTFALGRMFMSKADVNDYLYEMFSEDIPEFDTVECK